MSTNTADKPAILASLEAEKHELSKRIQEIDRALSGYDSWYDLALSIISPPSKSSGVLDSPGHAATDTSDAETLTGRIIGLLDSQPDRSFTPVELARLLQLTPDDINGRTSYLVKNQRIRRVGRGRYQSIHAPQIAAVA